MNLKKSKEKINSYNIFSCHFSEMDISKKAEAVRQGNANIELEGFVLDKKIIDLNRRFVSGEISFQDKLVLIKNLYSHT